MDIKDIENKVSQVIKKAESDPDFMAALKRDPVKTVEGLLGVDLPDAEIMAIAEAARGKISLEKGADSAKEIIGEIGDKIGGFLHKDK